MKKRILSMLLALTMVLSLLPMTAVTASAEEKAAQIGSTYYKTLQDAIKACPGTEEEPAQTATTIVLQCDSYEGYQGFNGVSEGKNIILDLNGKAMMVTQAMMYDFVNYGTLTIKNGTVLSVPCNYFCIWNTGDLTLENVTLDITKVNVEGYTSTTQVIAVASSGGTVTLRDCCITAGEGQVAIASQANSVPVGPITIESGKYIGLIGSAGNEEEEIPAGDIIIKGGLFDRDVSDYVASGYKCVANTDAASKDTYSYMVVEESVAKIGDKEYPTVQAAVNKATAGQTVKMIADSTENITVESDDEITLDLNGFVLKADGASSVITDNGTLTITDSGKDKAHYFTYKSNDAWVYAGDTAPETGKIDTVDTIASDTVYVKVLGGCITGGTGTLQNINPSMSRCTGGGIASGLGSKLTLESGNIVGNATMSGSVKYGGGVYAAGSFTMTGGKIIGNASSGFGGGVYNIGTFSLYGGEISGNTATTGGGVYTNTTENEVMTVGKTAVINDNWKGSEANNLYVATPIAIAKDENAPTSGMEIGVSMETPGAFTTNGSESDLAYFFSDNIAYKMEFVKEVTTPTPAAAHLALSEFDLSAVKSNTVSIALENDAMTSPQAIAIATEQKPYAGLTEDTVIAYAKGDTFSTDGKYLTIKADKNNNWATGTPMTVKEMRDAVTAATGSKAIFVIGTVSNHTHAWTYAQGGTGKENTLLAYCTANDCYGTAISAATAQTLTISAPALTVYGGNESEKAILSVTTLGGLTVSDSNVKYYAKGADGNYGTTALDAAPKAAGSYKAVLTVNDGTKDLTAYVEYSIAKAQVDVPTANTNLTYDGNQKTGVADAAEDAKYTVSGNKQTNAGSYKAKAVLKDKANYEWKNKSTSADQEIAWSIAKAASSVSTAPTKVDNLSYTGNAQALVSGGSVTGGTLKYATGTNATTAPADSAFGTTVPTGKNVGTYYVWYKVFGDSNHNDTTAVCITNSIAKATDNAITGTLTCADITEGGTPAPTGVTAKYGIVKYVYSADGATWDTWDKVNNGVGEYQVKAIVEGTNDYNEAKSNAASFTVKEKTSATIKVSTLSTKFAVTDTVIFTAEVTNRPCGSYVVWTTEGASNNFSGVSVCTDQVAVQFTAKGEVTVTAKLMSKDGQVLAADSQTVTVTKGPSLIIRTVRAIKTFFSNLFR